MSTTASPSPAQGLSIQGYVHGGEQSVAGAHIYLLGSNTTGYGAQSVDLMTLNASLPSDSVGHYTTTGSFGSFSITGDYACTSGQQVYLLALGGDSSGNHTGANYANIGLMADLGACPLAGTFLATIPYIYINEATTVAAAYALSGFMVDYDHLSAPAFYSDNVTPDTLAQTGLANAAANGANLVDITTGIPRTTTTGGNGTVPIATIKTLANIIASCIDSNEGTACITLFENATSDGVATSSVGGGTNPAETATAIINIAHHPAANVSTLLTLATGVGAPYGGGSSPNNFTLPLIFHGNVSAPEGIAIDASGNAWISNLNGNNVTELSSSGALVGNYAPTSSHFDDPIAIAIDSSGSVWVANTYMYSSSITKLSSNGSSASNFTDSSIVNPLGLAIDASGAAWVVSNGSNYVTRLNANGSVAGSSYTGVNNPVGIAIDPSGNAWVANGNNVISFNSIGNNVNFVSNYSPAGNNYDDTYAIAIGPSADIWVTNLNNNSITELTGGGAAASNYTPSSTYYPYALAFDGAGNIWIDNAYGYSISELSSAGGLIGNFDSSSGGSFAYPYALAIDGSGNVWVPNANNSTVTELIGAATPVVTPIVANLLTSGSGGHYGGTSTVNKP